MKKPQIDKNGTKLEMFLLIIENWVNIFALFLALDLTWFK